MPRTILLVGPGEAGHALPMLAVAHALSGRGHRVLFHGYEKFADAAGAAGVLLIPCPRYRPLMDRMADPIRVPWWIPGQARSIWKFRRVLVETVRDLANDLAPILRSEPIDCVISDFLTGMGAGYAAERVGVPHASVGTTPIEALDAGGLPMLLGNPYLRRVPPRALAAFVDRLFPLSQARTDLGLPPRRTAIAEFLRLAASESLHLVLAHRGFLPNEPSLAGQEFVGPMVFDPPWSGDTEALLASLSPGTIVLTTTTTHRDGGLLARTLQAVAPLGRPVFATGASRDAIPAGFEASIRVEPFAPHGAILAHPHVAALVTHGGWGTFGHALQHGVPTLILSIFGDQPMVGAQAAERGLARHLPAAEATPEAIRANVEALLADAAARRRLIAVADEIRRLDPPRRTAELVEALIDRASAAPSRSSR